jgi:hypothetical protein
MIDAAEIRGWWVLEADLRTGGGVTLASAIHPDTEVTIRSVAGMHNITVIASLHDFREKPSRSRTVKRRPGEKA